MGDLWETAWYRFSVISGVVSDANARAIAILFYFTIFVPFGIASRLLGDPMRLKETTDENGNTRLVGHEWAKRDPIPQDMDYAKEQG